MPSWDLLLDHLPASAFYVDRQIAFEALRDRGQFNAIDLASAYKADLVIRKQRPFSEEEFRRRVHGIVEGISVTVATAEDLILSKLEWSKMGGSARQIEDVARIIGSRMDRLDHAYIEAWVERPGIQGQWEAAVRESQKFP